MQVQERMPLVFSLLVASAFLFPASSTDPSIRPCEAVNGERSGARKARSEKKRHGKEDNAPPPNCVEVRLSALDAQEYFQKFIRERQWFTRDQQASEQVWTFTISLDKESLAKYTKPFADSRIQWRGGKGLVQIRTTEKNDGYTAVSINATFDGFGESEDALATRRDVWPLESNGSLESEMIQALELHIRSLQ